MDYNGRPGSRSVVTLADFCDQYNIGKDARIRMGVYNEGVITLGRGSFLDAQKVMETVRFKRQREEEWLREGKRLRVSQESFEGSTLDARQIHEEIQPFALPMCPDSSYWAHQNHHEEILMSEDTLGERNGTESPRIAFQALSSAGVLEVSTQEIPTLQIPAVSRPGILNSEASRDGNSSPPPPHR